MASPSAPRHLVLLGLRASGKSTIGALVAADLARPFVDLDDRTAALLGATSAGDAFRAAGEAAFRRAESKALAEALSGAPVVLALGGGTPTAPGAADLLQAARVQGRAYIVFLDPSTDVMVTRLERDAGNRPSLTGRGVIEEIEEIAARRRPLYAALADRVVTGAPSVSAAKSEVLSAFASIAAS
ncbi:MAG: shikimate kinase [bacterium]